MENSPRSALPHEAILLSRSIKEKKQLKITFIDGDILIESLRWHTPTQLGMNDGKVVNKAAIKFWEVLD